MSEQIWCRCDDCDLTEFEGPMKEAVERGWAQIMGRDVCPKCLARREQAADLAAKLAGRTA